MPNKRIITIDGGNGVGKTTLVHDLHELYTARGHNVLRLTTGNLYRAIALLAYEAADSSFELAAATTSVTGIALARARQLEFRDGIVHLNGTEVPRDDLRSEAITKLTPLLAKHGPIRQYVELELVRPTGHAFEGYVLSDGRTMGRDVFPDAPVKLFLTVDDAEAARRHGHSLEMVQQRNRHDRERPVGAMVPATDAHVIDTTLTSPVEKLMLVDQIITQVFPELAQVKSNQV